MRKALGLALVIPILLCGRSEAQELGPVPPVATTALSASWPPTLPGAGPRSLLGFNAANNNASARWVLIYDSSTVPADGATTPVGFFLLAGSGSPPNNAINITYLTPVRTFNGLVFSCSSTGPYTKTAATDCAFSVQVQ